MLCTCNVPAQLRPQPYEMVTKIRDAHRGDLRLRVGDEEIYVPAARTPEAWEKLLNTLTPDRQVAKKRGSSGIERNEEPRKKTAMEKRPGSIEEEGQVPATSSTIPHRDIEGTDNSEPADRIFQQGEDQRALRDEQFFLNAPKK